MLNESLKGLLALAVITVRKHYLDRIVILYHNDADGIASGFILKTALTRAGLHSELFCPENCISRDPKRNVVRFAEDIIRNFSPR